MQCKEKFVLFSLLMKAKFLLLHRFVKSTFSTEHFGEVGEWLKPTVC